MWGIRGIERSDDARRDPFATFDGVPIYDSAFNLRDPNAQVHIHTVCQTFMMDSQFTVPGTGRCAVSAFAVYQKQNGLPFPVPADSFDAYVQRFLLSNGGSAYYDDLGFNSTQANRRTLYFRAVFKSVCLLLCCFNFSAEQNFLRAFQWVYPATEQRAILTFGSPNWMNSMPKHLYLV